MNNRWFGRYLGFFFLISLSQWCFAEDSQVSRSDVSVVGTSMSVETSLEQESYLSQWSKTAAASGFTGAVLVIKGEDILFEQGFGLADKENKKPFTSDTVVDILSLTKQFTAAAILKLEELGALSVNDPLTHFFDDVPEAKRGITLHHLLTHTSGIKANYKHDYRKVERKELEQHILRSKLVSMPGQKYLYSNAGYSLLGIVIEKVSGLSYERFLRKYLFEPAGMNQTGYRFPTWEPDSFAIGYRSRAITFLGYMSRLAYWLGMGDRWGSPLDQYWAEDGPWWSLRANGGLLSTLNDLHLWQLALETKQILSEASIHKLFYPHVKEAEGEGYYGYGWVVIRNNGNIQRVFHNGGNPYFFSTFCRFVSNEVVLLFATNDWDVVLSGQIHALVQAVEMDYPNTQE